MRKTEGKGYQGKIAFSHNAQLPYFLSPLFAVPACCAAIGGKAQGKKAIMAYFKPSGPFPN
jgi:hypothetical protein